LQKRSLGFKFHNQNVLLRGFVRFAEERGDRYITSARVRAWAAGAPSPEHRRTRLLTVRRFALALHAENARHQIPQADALGRAASKRRPPSVGARTDDASASVTPAASAQEMDAYDTAYGRQIPCSVKLIPCSAKIIPCSVA
jgi:hypothetical protein